MRPCNTLFSVHCFLEHIPDQELLLCHHKALLPRTVNTTGFRAREIVRSKVGLFVPDAAVGGTGFAEGLCGYTMRLELLEFLGTTLPDKIECSHKSSREVAPINQTRRIPTVHVEQLRTCFNLPHLRAARSPRTAIVPDAAR
jgi:hypothetical protein